MILRTAELAGGTKNSKGMRHYKMGELFMVGEATALAMRTNIKRKPQPKINTSTHTHMVFPFNIEALKQGNPEAIEWARSLSQSEKDMMNTKYQTTEDPYLGQLLGEVERIQDGSFIPYNDLRILAKEAFLKEDAEAQQKISEYYGYEKDDKATDGASLAYMMYSQDGGGLVLAYAVLCGIDTDRARELFDDPGDFELKSPWDYSNYNSDRDIVFTEMIDTLLYEDSQSTKWKKAPHIILRQLIAEGHTHPGISAFLEKYKDKQWAQTSKKQYKGGVKRKKGADNGLSILGLFMIILVVSFAAIMIYIAGAFVIGIGSIFGFTNGIEGSSWKEICITGLCVCAIPVTYKLFKSLRNLMKGKRNNES